MASFVLTLELEMTAQDCIFIEKRFRVAELLYNACLRELMRRYDVYLNSHKRKVMRKNNYKNLNSRLASLKAELGISQYSMHSFIKDMQKKYNTNIDSATAQKIATRAFNTFKKKMKGEAKKVFFKSKGDLLSFEGKTNKSGIVFREDEMLLENSEEVSINFKNYSLIIGTNGNKKTIPVKIKEKDAYAQLAIQSKVKYCRVLRKYIRDKVRYFVQLVLDGIPPLKKRKIGKGNVGIDDGTASMAISANLKVSLLELAPKCKMYDRAKKILLRAMDRSRRANNPQNYNEDGTIKKGKKTWIKSKRYIKLENKYRNLCRKIVVYRTIEHNRMTNEILALGDVFKTEKVAYKGLQKKAKHAKRSEKNGKWLSRKRFGKSIGNRAPSEFLAILDRKLKYFGKKLNYINTKTSKCSQYDHVSDTYNKKEIGDRMHILPNGRKIQRDCYSSFLIENVNLETETVDKKKCDENFERFLSNYEKEIERILEQKSKGVKLLSSFGL